MPLSPEQRSAFERDGFVNLGAVFTESELTTIASEYDRLVTFDAQTLGNEADGRFPYRAMLNFRSPPLAAFILHPSLLDLASGLLGPDVRFWWDQGINKAPGAGSKIDWHQDNGYKNGRTQEFLTLWLALDDSSLENGGLEVIPGSARDVGWTAHEWQGPHAVLPDGHFDPADAVPLDAQAGDLLLFSSLLVHRTVGNHTRDRNRRAWVVQYCRADQRNEATGEIYDNRPWVVREGVFANELVSERPFDLKRDRA